MAAIRNLGRVVAAAIRNLGRVVADRVRDRLGEILGATEANAIMGKRFPSDKPEETKKSSSSGNSEDTIKPEEALALTIAIWMEESLRAPAGAEFDCRTGEVSYFGNQAQVSNLRTPAVLAQLKTIAGCDQ